MLNNNNNQAVGLWCYNNNVDDRHKMFMCMIYHFGYLVYCNKVVAKFSTEMPFNRCLCYQPTSTFICTNLAD